MCLVVFLLFLSYVNGIYRSLICMFQIQRIKSVGSRFFVWFNLLNYCENHFCLLSSSLLLLAIKNTSFKRLRTLNNKKIYLCVYIKMFEVDECLFIFNAKFNSIYVTKNIFFNLKILNLWFLMLWMKSNFLLILLLCIIN